jgi:uncharacterized protein (TIGR02118 family)
MLLNAEYRDAVGCRNANALALFLKTAHMPLVARHWKKHGLKLYAVSKLNADSPYSYSVVIDFESYEGFKAAGADPNTKEVMDDVANFSSEAPTLLHGGVIDRETV